VHPASEENRPSDRFYISRRFALLWAGTLLSAIGDMIFEFTLIVWAAQRYGDSGSWLVAGIFVASLVPTIVVGPIAGTLVDQGRDKVRVVVRASGLIAVLTVLLAPLLAKDLFGTGPALPTAVQSGLLLGVVAIISAVNQFIRPAEGIIARDIVAEPDRPRSASLNQIAFGIAILVGPPLAAPLFISFGLTWALALNAASFVASAALVRIAARGAVLDEPAAVEGAELTSEDGSPRARLTTVWTDLVAGLRMFGQSPTLTTIALCLIIALAGFGLLNAVDPFFVIYNLGGSAEIYGWFGTAQGAGSLIGAVTLSVIANRFGMPAMFCAGMAAIGFLTLIYAQLASVPAGLALIFLFGLVFPAVDIAISPIMLRVTPRAYLGRVGGTLNPLINVATLVGVLAGGTVYGVLGQSFSVTFLGVQFGALDGLLSLTGLLSILAAAYAWRRFASSAVRDEMELAPGVDRPALAD
jgi:MFS family permease